jgi:hypothetical protein
MWPRRRSDAFQQLLRDSYRRWLRDVEVVGPTLRHKPVRLPDPDLFFKMKLQPPKDVRLAAAAG